MIKRKKQALYTLAMAPPIFAYGAYSFELGGGGGAEAVAISMAITLGGFGTIVGLIMLFTKNRLGVFDSKPPSDKPIFIKKEENMVKIKKQKPVVITGSASQSIELMKREKELETRRKELGSLLAEVSKEEQAVEKELKNKGWILSADGWVVG